MSTLEDTQRKVFSVARQLASVDVRRRALATLTVGDVVRAVDPETGEAVGDRRITWVNVASAWPFPHRCAADGQDMQRRHWLADEDGRELHPWMDLTPGGWVLVRPWLTRPEVNEKEPPRTPFSWGAYARHMEAMWTAIVAGEFDMPEAPWD
jgi:hypothetical protein